MAGQVARRIVRLLERSGLAADADPAEADPLPDKEPLLALLYPASVAGHIATGRRAGQRVLRVGDRIDVDDLSVLESKRCASVGGVSMHATSPSRLATADGSNAWPATWRKPDILLWADTKTRLSVLSAAYPLSGRPITMLINHAGENEPSMLTEGATQRYCTGQRDATAAMAQ